MTENSIDLKQLIYLIDDNKELETNLILDEGCIIESTDPKPLVKVINYCLNYLGQLTDRPLEIGLDLRVEDCLLSMLAYSEKTDLPELSDKLNEALSPYKGQIEVNHNSGKFVQLKIAFKK